jgi:hypothetical protein
LFQISPAMRAIHIPRIAAQPGEYVEFVLVKYASDGGLRIRTLKT